MKQTRPQRPDLELEPQRAGLDYLMNGLTYADDGVTGLPLTLPEPQLSLCPDVPLAPPGVSLDENIKRAEGSWDPFWFYDQVRNKGPWDYKQRGHDYADFGNFNYGATAKAFGFPDQVIYRMAGWAQQKAGNSRAEFGNPLGLPPFGDDPHDQEMIDAGMRFRANRCRSRR